jgi:type IV pilus assembly protein PilZ
MRRHADAGRGLPERGDGASGTGAETEHPLMVAARTELRSDLMFAGDFVPADRFGYPPRVMSDAAEVPEPGDAERRDETRAPITLRVDYKRLNTFFADYTKNISAGGTFIRTTRPLAIGTAFKFVLALPPEGSTEVALNGIVKWIVKEGEANEEHPAGMGIQFVFRDDAERTQVEDVVLGLMRASLGSNIAEKLLRARG